MADVYVLDEIVVRPEQAAALRAAVDGRYRPAAERRGMRLVGSWRNPPERDFEGVDTTFYFLWSVPDVDGWWRMRLSRTEAGADERFEKHAFWREADELAVSRRRTVLSGLDGAGACS